MADYFCEGDRRIEVKAGWLDQLLALELYCESCGRELRPERDSFWEYEGVDLCFQCYQDRFK